MARGGKRPTAPQNNPMNVSATGGNGQNASATQAARYIPGLPYGEGQEMMDIQSSAPLAAAPGIESSGMATMAPGTAAAPPVVGINEPTMRPNEPVTSGAALGAGPGEEALGLGMADANADMNFKSQLAQYMPALVYIASRPNASPEARRVVSQLRAML